MRNLYHSILVAGKQVPLFADVSVAFDKQLTVITGPSGCGKSTFLHLVTGIARADRGSVFYDDTSLQNIDVFSMNLIGFVFQQAMLLPDLSVVENVMLPALIKGQDKVVARKKALNLLAQVGLTSHADHYSAVLSGGQQQKVALLRALFAQPSFLVVDEPTGNLDTDSGRQVMKMIKHYQNKYDIGVIIVTHDQSIISAASVIYQVENYKLKKV